MTNEFQIKTNHAGKILIHFHFFWVFCKPSMFVCLDCKKKKIIIYFYFIFIFFIKKIILEIWVVVVVVAVFFFFFYVNFVIIKMLVIFYITFICHISFKYCRGLGPSDQEWPMWPIPNIVGIGLVC